jgi:hypothetical protein
LHYGIKLKIIQRASSLLFSIAFVGLAESILLQECRPIVTNCINRSYYH